MSAKHLLSAYFAAVFLLPAIVTPKADFDGRQPEDGTPSTRALLEPLFPPLPVGTNPEDRLLAALDHIDARRLDQAEVELDAILADHPHFRLAQMVRADLLQARASGLAKMGEQLPAAVREQLAAEVRARSSARALDIPAGRVPAELLSLGEGTRHALVVDAALYRLYVFENRDGVPRKVADFYTSIGKQGLAKEREGDKKSPKGVYFITDWIGPERLDDFYGAGAWPLNYPNEWDRRLGRDGYGIWLHGTPLDTYSRPPRASDGCVVVSNNHFDALHTYARPGDTPVLITEGLEWTEPETVAATREDLLSRVQGWRRAWESLATDEYLAYYDPENFDGNGRGFASWAEMKRQVNARKQWVRLDLSDVSMFRYPGQPDLVVVSFEQDYQSDNLSDRMRKRQYWQLRDGQWRIIWEGAA